MLVGEREGEVVRDSEEERAGGGCERELGRGKEREMDAV